MATIALIFILGVLTQSILMLGNKLEPLNWFFCFAGSLIGLIPNKTDVPYNVLPHVLITSFIFCLMLMMFFKRKILPKIGEENLFSLILILWYVGMVFFQGSGRNFLIRLMILPTLGTLYLVLTKKRISFFWQVLAYSWYLIMIIALTSVNLIWGILQLPNQPLKIAYLDGIDVFLSGMAFCFLVVNITFIYKLIPWFPGKDQNLTASIDDWRHHCRLLADRYRDRQANFKIISQIAIFQGGSLAFNYFFGIIPHLILVNFWILLVPFLRQISSYYRWIIKSQPDALTP